MDRATAVEQRYIWVFVQIVKNIVMPLAMKTKTVIVVVGAIKNLLTVNVPQSLALILKRGLNPTRIKMK